MVIDTTRLENICEKIETVDMDPRPENGISFYLHFSYECKGELYKTTRRYNVDVFPYEIRCFGESNLTTITHFKDDADLRYELEKYIRGIESALMANHLAALKNVKYIFVRANTKNNCNSYYTVDQLAQVIMYSTLLR